MSAKGLLDMLLSAGQSMAQQGKDIAEERLNIPEDEGQRSAMMGGMGKGALAAGALALLLGTSGGRKVTGGALRVGSLAALGGLAFKAYKQWQNSGDETVAAAEKVAQTPPEHLESLSEVELDARSKKLLQAVVAAAKADGHIDDNERKMMNDFMANLGESDELNAFIQSELSTPLDPARIAADTQAPGLAGEVYLMSKMMINEENFMEKSYLDALANELKLDEALVAELDKQALDAVA